MYHQIGDPPKEYSDFLCGLYTSENSFEKQIAYMVKKNYKTLTSQEFFEILKSGKNPSQKSVLLTFDDATTSHYTKAYPILKKYKQTGVFFVPTHNSFISRKQLKEMSDASMDIQSHTQTHPNLTKISSTETLSNEIGGSKAELENTTKKNVVSIAYPGCVAHGLALQVTQNSGYSVGFSCGKSIDHKYANRMYLARLHAPDTIEELVQILSGIYPF
jgi:peptidoglycan/xylan/chitin deacetylase (PgdA/CDA1 family)